MIQFFAGSVNVFHSEVLTRNRLDIFSLASILLFMDRRLKYEQIIRLFIRMVHRYNSLEKIPVTTTASLRLYHSERHMLDAIGDHPGVNMTEFAREIGVTKGAVSQIVKKLESKGFVKRFKGIDNNKDVLLELTSSGKEAYLNHRQTNDVTISVLEEKMNPSSDENIEFLIDVFTWIGDYLEQSREMMKKR